MINKILVAVVSFSFLIFACGCSSADSSMSYSFDGNKDRYWDMSQGQKLEPVTLAENVPYVELFENDNDETIARFVVEGNTIETDYINVSIIQGHEVDKPIAKNYYGDKWELYIPSGKVLDLR